MSIFVDENTKVVVQGISPTSQGLYHGLRNRAYGTQVVAGTNPNRGGEEIEGIPVFATVAEAVEATGANASFISVPPKFAADAIVEAAAAGVPFVVCITEGIPAQDEALAYNRLVREFPATRLLGPNCPGIISPGKCNIGITSGDIAMAGGPVGIVSRSGTLTYQALHELSQQGVGQTTCVGIGGDPVPGTSFIDCLAAFEADPDTRAIMMIGEIGGSAEEEAAEFIASSVTKPVVSYVAGVTAPPGRKMGHAGAIISGSKGTAQAKMDALSAAGVTVALNPTEAGRGHGRRRPEARLSVGAPLGRGPGRPAHPRGHLRSRRPAHRLGAVLAPGGDRGVRLPRARPDRGRRPPDHGPAHRRRRAPLVGPVPVGGDDRGRGRAGGHRPGGRADRRSGAPMPGALECRGSVRAAVAAGGGVLRLLRRGHRGRPAPAGHRIRGGRLALGRVGAAGQAPPRRLPVDGGQAGGRPDRLPGRGGLLQRGHLGQGGPDAGGGGARAGGRSTRPGGGSATPGCPR